MTVTGPCPGAGRARAASCGRSGPYLASKSLGEYLHAVTSSVRRPVRPGPGASAGSPVMGDLDLVSVHVRGKVSAMFIPFVRTSPRTTVAGMLGAPLLALALTGCGSVQGALTEGQQAVDQARDAVETAAGSLAAAEDLIAAGTELAAACTAAQAAWVPGVSAGDARTAIDDALRLVDEAIALSPDVPGGAELKQALASSRDALASGDGTLGMSRETLQTACALVSMGG